MTEEPKDRRALTSAENGRRSRGPITPAGKRRSSQNGRRHGILSAELVIDALGESTAELARLRSRLWEELEPVGLVEEMLAEQILVAYWRLRRVLIAEAGLLTQRAEAVADRLLAARRVAARRQPTPLQRHAAEPLDLSDDEAAAFSAAQLLGALDAERVQRHEAMLQRQLLNGVERLTELQTRRLAAHRMIASDH